MPRLTDTPPAVEKIIAAGYGRMPSGRKWKLIADAYHYGRHLHAAGLRDRNPAITSQEILQNWALTTLGDGPWMAELEGRMHSQPAEHQDVIRYVIECFEKEGIDYAVGASLASSLHGYPRYTQDADLAVEPFWGKESAFAAHFPASDYYADVLSIRDAVSNRGSFNLIHYATMFKVDVFIRKDRRFDRSMWMRRQASPNFDPTGKVVQVVAAEDTILLKLEWYRLGGEQSSQQWNDIIGILRAQAGNLNDRYLVVWATDLGVDDLLQKARADAAIP